MPPLTALSTLLLCLVWATEVVRIFHPVPLLAMAGGACLATYMVLAFGRSSLHIRLLFIAVTAASIGIAWFQGSAAALLAGFDKGQIFGAFLPAVMLLRATAEASPRIAGIRSDLQRLDPAAAENWMQYGSHALGAVLNIGATAILAPVVKQGADAERRAALARSSARGIGGAVMWSPFFPALAFTSQLVPHSAMWQAMLIGVGLSVIGLVLSYVLFTPSLGWRGFKASIAGLKPLVAPMLLVIGIVVSATIVVGWSGLQSVALLVPLLCLGYLSRLGPDERGQVARRAAASFARLSDELLIVVGAAVLGACIGSLPAVQALGSSVTPGVLSGPILLAAVALVLLALGQVGLHPMIGTSIVVPIVAAGAFGVCGPVLVATAVFAWALFGSTAIWALPVAAGANLFDVPARQMLSRRTAMFALLCVATGLPYLAAANVALSWLGCR